MLPGLNVSLLPVRHWHLGVFPTLKIGRSELNAAIEVGTHQLEVALGSAGELWSEDNEARAIKGLVKRLVWAAARGY
jgi:hypothetical protein